MSKVNVVRRCYSCGAILQSEDKNKEGYIDEEFLSASPLDRLLFCSHCYNEAHYNLLPQEPQVDEDFLLMLDDARASDALIVYVIDTISFESYFSRAISERVKGLKMLVLANKRDLMPSAVKDADLCEYVAHRFRVASLPVTKDQVILASLTTMGEIKEIAKRIDDERKRHDVYIIGPTGSGKSLFFTAFLRNYSNASGLNITTANYPGTNLQVMQIPLDASAVLYDTPGTSIKNSVIGLVEPDCAHAIQVHNPLKPRRILLSKGDVIFIGGLAQIELTNPGKSKGGHVDVKAYFSDEVSLKKAAIRKDLGGAFQKYLAHGQIKPTSHLVKSLKDMDIFDFSIEETGSRDLGIAGLGWINFVGAEQTFRLYVPKGVSVYGSRCKVK
jgi:ribosome biogenesis GTPase A